MVAGALWRGWAIAAPPCQLSRRGGHGQRGAPVWHIHEPVDRLKRLCDEWERVCIGSSAQFHVVGAQNWHLRIVLEHDGIKSELAKVIERIHARPHRPRTTFIVALPNGCQVKKWHLRLRFDSARKAAADLALKAGDEELTAASRHSSSAISGRALPATLPTWAPPAPCWDIVKKSSRKRSIGALARLSALPASGELRKPFPRIGAKLKLMFYIRDFAVDSTKKISP